MFNSSENLSNRLECRDNATELINTEMPITKLDKAADFLLLDGLHLTNPKCLQITMLCWVVASDVSPNARRAVMD